MKHFLRRQLPWLLIVLFAIQPCLDVLSFWTERAGWSNLLTLALRMGIFACVALSGFLLSDRKKIYFILAGILLALALGHVWACHQVGYDSPITDLTNYIRVIQLPVFLLCLITFQKQNRKCYPAMQIGLLCAFGIILLVEAVSYVLRIQWYTYADGSGIIGWFSNTNSQSSNLCVLLPVTLGWQLTHQPRRPALFWATAILGVAALYFFGTRLAFLGIFATCLGLAISILLSCRKRWKTALALTALALICLGAIQASPMTRHLQIYAATQNDRQYDLNQKLGDTDAETKALLAKARADQDAFARMTPAEQARIRNLLAPVYEMYAADFVEIFGLEQTLSILQYSTTISDFSAVRTKKLIFAQHLMAESPLSARFFGMDLNRFYVDGKVYDVENDLHGIYYLYGIVGLSCVLALLLYFVYLILWALKKDWRRYFTPESAGLGIAFLLCLAHIYCTCGVLRRPNASIFLAAVLAGIYEIVRLRKEDAV